MSQKQTSLPSSPSPARSWWGQVLFWSVISAAFIGPGTVTTAAAAGATFGAGLLWALVFSTIACVILQYAAAMLQHRLGMPLGQALSLPFGPRGRIWVRYGTATAIMVGGIAYQGGNLLGAMLGLRLLWPALPSASVLGLGFIAALLLWIGNSKSLTSVLGTVVAAMGIMFLILAYQTPLSVGALLGGLVPRIPTGGLWLALGLVGTTIVPYNLFLAAGLSAQSSPKGILRGQSLAIGLGGLFSVGILLAGSLLLDHEFSMEALGAAADRQLGSWGAPLLGLGLAGAGLTSAITAPWAAGLTLRSIFGPEAASWQDRGRNFRLTWGSVLVAGLIFSVLHIKPVPAIILAQALNGLLLPGLAALLWWLYYHPQLNAHLPTAHPVGRLSFLVIVVIVTILGLLGLTKAVASLFGFDWQASVAVLPLIICGGILLGGGLLWRFRQIATQRS